MEQQVVVKGGDAVGAARVTATAEPGGLTGVPVAAL